MVGSFIGKVECEFVKALMTCLSICWSCGQIGISLDYWSMQILYELLLLYFLFFLIFVYPLTIFFGFIAFFYKPRVYVSFFFFNRIWVQLLVWIFWPSVERRYDQGWSWGMGLYFCKMRCLLATFSGS